MNKAGKAICKAKKCIKTFVVQTDSCCFWCTLSASINLVWNREGTPKPSVWRAQRSGPLRRGQKTTAKLCLRLFRKVSFLSLLFISHTHSPSNFYRRTESSVKTSLVFHHFIRNETLVAARNTILRDKLQRQKRDLFNDFLLTDFPKQAEKAPFHPRRFLTRCGQLLKLLL